MRWGALALLWCAGAAFAEERPLIVVDPGHGGAQEGALGPGGVKEKELALQIAARLKAALEQRVHARVRMTRQNDVGVHLSDRVAWANEQKPDLFVSVHANSMPTQRLRERTQGIETFFLSANASGEEARRTADRENAEVAKGGPAVHDDLLAYILADLQRSEVHADSSRLAYAVHQRLVARTEAEDRGVQQAPFYVLMGVEAPAILVEVGFISSPQEGPKLADAKYQEMLASAIAEGVQAFLAQVHGRDGARVTSSGG